MDEIVAAGKAVLALCAQHGAPLAQGREMAAALEEEDDKRRVVARLLHGLFVDVVREEETPPAWALGAFESGLQTLWQGLSTDERLASGLYPRWVTVLSLQGRLEAVTAVTETFGEQLSQPACAPLATALLRQCRRLEALAPTLRLLALLAPSWRAGRPWAGELAVALGFAARQAVAPADLDRIRAWAAPLYQALNARNLEPKLRNPLLRNLVVVARRTVDLAAMRSLCRVLAGDNTDKADRADPVDAEHLPALVQMLAVLLHFEHFIFQRDLLKRLAAQHPLDAPLQLLRARYKLQSGSAMAASLVELVGRLVPGSPGQDEAERWLAGVLFHMGDEQAALASYRRAQAQRPLSEVQRRRLLQLTAKLEPDHPDAAALAHDATRLDAADFAHWAPALQPLAALMNLPLTHGSQPDATQIEVWADASLTHFQAALPRVAELQIDTALLVARRLGSLADAALRRTATRPEAMGVPAGPGYGTLDPLRHRIVLEAASRHIVALCEHALALEPLLQLPGQLPGALDLAGVLVERLCQLGEPSRALRRVALLQVRLGGLGEQVLAHLAERCQLERGDLAGAREAGERAGNDDATETLSLQAWAEWAAGPGQAAELLIDEPAMNGSFEVVRADGRIHRVLHATPAVTLQTVAVQRLVVRNSFAAIAPHGSMLLPHPWHLASGEYPYKAPSVVNRGAAGVTLVRAARLQRVEEPVLVLGNMDAAVHRHYYRWMLLVLTRIHAARQAGLLAQRKLLLPAELTPWMLESLDAIGVSPEQRLPYSRAQALVLDDALVMQPIEYTAPALVNAVRAQLLAAAGPAEGGGRPLFISRQGAASRPLANEDDLMALAAEMGFDVVEPRALGLLEQVRLFASARGVVASPGAGFANLMFAPAGIRVLSLFKEEECLPTFAELAIARGQGYRWLLGASDPRFSAGSVARAPFRIDPALARREFAWVAEAAGSD